MAKCREVAADRRKEMGSFARSPGGTCLLDMRIRYDPIVEVNVVSVRSIGGRRRSGLRPSASLPDFAGLVPATRGLIAAPWTLASLSLLPSGKRVQTDHVPWRSIRGVGKRGESPSGKPAGNSRRSSSVFGGKSIGPKQRIERRGLTP